MKGTNGIYSGTLGYLSRMGIQNKLIIYGLITAKPEILWRVVFCKPEGSTTRGFFKPEL